MASQAGKQRITINILPDISKSKGNWSIFEAIDIWKKIREALILILEESLVPNKFWLWGLFQYIASCLTGSLLSDCGCLLLETITQRGIACMKIPCYICDSACSWFIAKIAKIVSSYVKHFWNLSSVGKCRILIGLCRKAFLNCPTIFFHRHNKLSYYQILFLTFKTLMKKK